MYLYIYIYPVQITTREQLLQNVRFKPCGHVRAFFFFFSTSHFARLLQACHHKSLNDVFYCVCVYVTEFSLKCTWLIRVSLCLSVCACQTACGNLTELSFTAYDIKLIPQFHNSMFYSSLVNFVWYIKIKMFVLVLLLLLPICKCHRSLTLV